MVTRVTTNGNYSAIVSNLMSAQQRQNEAGERVSTQKNGVNLKDFAKSSELLTAMRTVQSRVQAFSEQNKLTEDKLATQDTALNRVADATASIRQLITDALASGRADTLVQDIQAQMSDAVEGMNARYAGKYLFAGGQIDTRPVTAATLSDLTAPPASIAAFFQNDTFKSQSKLDESSTVTTGMLASDIGTGLLTALQAFQTFNEGATGNFNGQLTAAQQTFLEGQLATWDSVRADVTLQTAQNGARQKRVDTVNEDLVSRQNQLAGMLGDITDANMPKASADLSQAQLAVQSAAYVFNALKESSLLNFLR